MKIYIVYKMKFYLDGNFPEFIGVFKEEPELKDGEYCEEIYLINQK